jgi:flagellar FliL protein
MAEEKEKKEEELDEEKKPKSEKSHKNLYVVIGIIVFALIGGVVAYTLLAGGKKSTHEAAKEEKKESKTTLVAFDSFILNLADQGRFLKLTMQFELLDAASQPLLTEKIPQIRDTIITLMGSKSVESVSSAEGKLQLKDELLLRSNQAVGKDIFKNLYFTEFIVQ